MSNIIKEINALEQELTSNIELSKSFNTLKSYRSDFKDFQLFCVQYGFQYLPTTPKTIGLYISKISKYLKYSTLKRRIASIKVIHNIKGHYLDCKHPLIRENLLGIRRIIGSYQISKKALDYSNLLNIIKYINNKLENKNTLIFRDKALLLVGFSGGFRRSELVNLKIDDLEFVHEGLKITIKKSKSDQLGLGTIKAIPYHANREFCPVSTLKDWLNVKKASDYVFDCSDKMVALVVKKYVSLIGLNPKLYSGHSLRSGFATSTANEGADERSIMNMTGHKSVEMVRRYIKEANLFKNNALNKLKV